MAVGYVVSCWLILQAADLVFDIIGTPDWAIRTIAAIMALAFPVVLFFSWAYEVTPEGIKRESEVEPSDSITHVTARRLDFVIFAVLTLAMGYFLWERQTPHTMNVASPSETVENYSVTSVEGPKRRSIAVLPFANLSSDPQQGWFADGLTEELLNSLARTTDLLVAARTSAFKYKGSNKDIPAIARELGVENVLEGSVRRSGDRLRVTATLIKAADGFQIWSQDYDRDAADIIDLQEELAASIAHALETAVDPEALAAMVNVGTRSVLAYESYVRGLQLQQDVWASVNLGDAESSLKAFERAIQIDSKFSRAYMGIVRSWGHQADPTYSALETNAIKMTAISNAITHEKDPIAKLGYRAQKAMLAFELLTALQLSTEYLESRPNSHDGQALHLSILLNLRRFDEGVEAAKIFYKRDGFDIQVTDVSLLILRNGTDKEFASELGHKVIERFPDQPLLLYQAHRALLAAGEPEPARDLPSIIHKLYPHDTRLTLMTLGQLCAEGRDREAIEVYEAAKTNPTFEGSWTAHKMMSQDDEAIRVLAHLDNAKNVRSLLSYLGVGYFDPRPYPNLMAFLESKGIPPLKVTPIPYRCRYGASE